MDRERPRALPGARRPRDSRLRPLSVRALAAAAEVPGSGPWRQQQEDLRAAVAPDRMALIGLEVGERAGRGLDLAVGARDLRGALDDEEPCVLLDLVVAELLPWIEADEDRPRLVFALQDDGRTSAGGCRDLGEPPALHRAPVKPGRPVKLSGRCLS